MNLHQMRSSIILLVSNLYNLLFKKTYRFIEKGELFDEIIRRRYLRESDAAYVIRQVLSAITYCHSKNIMHRDLKPENILIDSIDSAGMIRIKVIDFGTALYFTPSASFKETQGTAYYIAPEVLNGNYTEKCDVWSIGVILYVLLCGMAPFNGLNDEDIMASVKAGEYSFSSIIWEAVSDDAKDLIKKMLTYRPDKRPAASDSYQHKWLTNAQLNLIKPEITQELARNMGKFCVILLKLNI